MERERNRLATSMRLHLWKGRQCDAPRRPPTERCEFTPRESQATLQVTGSLPTHHPRIPHPLRRVPHRTHPSRAVRRRTVPPAVPKRPGFATDVRPHRMPSLFIRPDEHPTSSGSRIQQACSARGESAGHSKAGSGGPCMVPWDAPHPLGIEAHTPARLFPCCRRSSPGAPSPFTVGKKRLNRTFHAARAQVCVAQHLGDGGGGRRWFVETMAARSSCMAAVCRPVSQSRMQSGLERTF